MALTTDREGRVAVVTVDNPPVNALSQALRQSFWEAVATLDAYPDWQIPAHVIMPVPTADRQKATVKVRLGFEQLEPRILPDMGVKVAFLGDEKPGAAPGKPMVTIPRAAVRKDGDRDVVFVIQGNKVERRAVGLATGSGDEAVVTSGLAGGEQVVVEGPADLKDGATVSVRNSEPRR